MLVFGSVLSDLMVPLTKSQMLPFTNSKMGAEEGGDGEEELH